jgi:hypothetical protein
MRNSYQKNWAHVDLIQNKGRNHSKNFYTFLWLYVLKWDNKWNKIQIDQHNKYQCIHINLPTKFMS